MKVINFFAGPGAGKSTVAAGLFHQMKIGGFSVELVTEFAKDIVYAEDFKIFGQQDYVFAQQRHRLERLRGKVEYVITDSPILLMVLYSEQQAAWSSHTNDIFKSFVINIFEREYDNINYFLHRPEEGFSKDGRYHNLDESKKIDTDILSTLNRYKIRYKSFISNEYTHCDIFDNIAASHENRRT